MLYDALDYHHSNDMKIIKHPMILVIAEPAQRKGEDADTKTMKDFLLTLQKQVQPVSTIQKIGESSWQIPADTGLPFLADLLRWKGVGVSLRILFLEEEPEWIVYPPSA
jgi:hypothetical protein